jgi:hypothetical protein
MTDTLREAGARKEIELLLEADRQGCLLVDKDSHVLLERDELMEAQRQGLYQNDAGLSHEGTIEVSSPFPGCVQYGAATNVALDFRIVGQTEHFVVFCPARRAVPSL